MESYDDKYIAINHTIPSLSRLRYLFLKSKKVFLLNIPRIYAPLHPWPRYILIVSRAQDFVPMDALLNIQLGIFPMCNCEGGCEVARRHTDG